MRRRLWRGTIPGFAAVFAVLGGLLALQDCGATQPPNVLLIVVDTLRFDHLGCYGYERPTSPALDALAQEGVLFRRAYAPSSWTLPSVASILTGLYPSAHRATHIRTRLPSEARTLAEILSDHGYATGGVVSHVFLSAFLNMNQGFGIYSEREAGGEDHVSTAAVTNQALQTLRYFRQQHEPFFLFVHYFDPHYRYIRHPEYGFAAPTAGRLDGSESILDVRAMGSDMTGEEIGFLRDLYDEEIRFTDTGIGRLLDTFRDSGLLDDTLVIVTADHGEELMERGWLGHTRTLYEELVRVPLIVRLPLGVSAGVVVDTPVSLVSLVPTILELLDLQGQAATPYPAPSLRQLLTADRVQRATEATPAMAEGRRAASAYCEVDFIAFTPDDRIKEAHKKALIGPRYKLMVDDDSGRTALYDLAHDPGEQRDLSQEQAELTQHLLDKLRAQELVGQQRRFEESQRALSEEQIRRLQTLGYIGSSPQPAE